MSWVPIASTVLTSSSSTITFSSIPQTFKDLILVSRIITSSNVTTGWRINNQTASYETVYFAAGSGLSPLSSQGGGNRIDPARANSFSSNILSSIFQINDYKSTSKYKNVIYVAGNGAYRLEYGVGYHANTSATTTLQVVTTGSYLAGSSFSLYGIEG